MFKRKHASQPVSPCGVAFDDRNGQVVIAEYATGSGYNIYNAVIGERRAVDIISTDVRTTVTRGNAHTDALPLALHTDASEETILKALVEKTDGDRAHQLAFTRTPDARIIVTQVEARAVDHIVSRTEKWLEEQEAPHLPSQRKTLRIETRTRAITRLWRVSQGDTPLVGTAATLVLGEEDYSIGLWSEASGLVYETEEDFEAGASTEIKCLHTRDTLAKFITPASLAKLRLPEVTHVAISAAESYGDSMLSLLNDSPEFHSTLVQAVSIDKDETASFDQPTALAIGALLSHSSVSPCNLVIGPQARLAQIQAERESEAASERSARARAAVFALLLPFAAAAGFLLAVFVVNFMDGHRLQTRIDEETAVAQTLAQANADYESSKANFAAFQSLLDNLINLRQRQPAAHQLLTDLNQRWPQDASWYISELNVKGANVEIKGKTRSEQAITSFAKSLEFSNGLFSGILTRNNVEGNSPNPAGNQAKNQPPRSSVIEFTITSTYAPLVTHAKSTVNAPAQLTQPAPPNGTNLPKPATEPAIVPISPSNLPLPISSQEKTND